MAIQPCFIRKMLFVKPVEHRRASLTVWFVKNFERRWWAIGSENLPQPGDSGFLGMLCNSLSGRGLCLWVGIAFSGKQAFLASGMTAIGPILALTADIKTANC
jgi:hypothetical protein